jgi:hypothetical protein
VPAVLGAAPTTFEFVRHGPQGDIEKRGLPHGPGAGC